MKQKGGLYRRIERKVFLKIPPVLIGRKQQIIAGYGMSRSHIHIVYPTFRRKDPIKRPVRRFYGFHILARQIIYLDLFPIAIGHIDIFLVDKCIRHTGVFFRTYPIGM